MKVAVEAATETRNQFSRISTNLRFAQKFKDPRKTSNSPIGEYGFSGPVTRNHFSRAELYSA
jgi:hypothetical protein